MKQILDGRRNVLDGSSQIVIEKLGQEDINFKANVSDNQWFIQQAIMWASVATAEMELERLRREQGVRGTHPPRAE